jgi:hypothetical protein
MGEMNMYLNDQLPEQLDEYIKNGIRKAQKRKRNKMIRRGSGVACFLLLTLFLSAVRISPAFAAYVSKIPGLEYVVVLIRYNKGLQSAVENEFIQPVNVSDEHQGIVLTVKDIIVDNTSMVVFYTIKNSSKHEMPRLTDVNIADATGSDLEVSFDYGFTPYEGSEFSGRLNISFPGEEQPNFQIPDSVSLTSKMMVGDPDVLGDDCLVLGDTWKMLIPIDKTKFENMERKYELDQTVKIAGQKIHFEKAVIYPTRVSVDLSFDDSNTMEIFAFEDLALIDEKGNEWGTIQDGVTLIHLSDTRKRIFFQSNYFTMPEKLLIKGSGIRALDKDKSELVIDLDSKRILRAPDEKTRLKELSLGKTSLSMIIELNTQPDWGGASYEFLSWIGKDGLLQELKRESEGRTTGREQAYVEYYYKYSFLKPLKSPLRFKISDYPNKIEKQFEVIILP